MPTVATVRKPALAAGVLAAMTPALGFVLLRPGGSSATASSNSEVQLITPDPRADNTDLYALGDPNGTSKATMTANHAPLESSASGPTFYSFDDSVPYQIALDNDGDGVPDIGYQFQFKT
jgi:hypothetical protein